MAVDLSSSKFPDFSLDGRISREYVRSSAWPRLFPLIDAQTLRRIYLRGIPLVSFFPDPVSGLRPEWTDQDLEYIIQRIAVPRVETLSHCLIAPSEVVDTGPFDRNEYEAYGYMQLQVRPISALLALRVTSANRDVVFDCPIEWVAAANLFHGQINILPMGVLAAPLALAPSASPFILYMLRLGWIPQFWQIHYVAGFLDFLVPDFVNDLLGVTAAIEVLSQLGATYAWMTGGSLGIDGLSQSSSGPGPQAFQTRIGELKEMQERLIKKFRKMCGLALSAGAV